MGNILTLVHKFYDKTSILGSINDAVIFDVNNAKAIFGP